MPGIKRKAFAVAILTLLLTSTFVATFNVLRAKAIGTIYIRADGSIDPSDAPIITYDYVTYTLTDNITSSADGIVVERDNIIIDGAGYTLQGTWAYYSYSKGIDLTERTNVTVKNVRITVFYYGIFISSSTNNIVRENDIVNNGWYDHGYGIYLISSSNNTLLENDVTHDWVNGTAYGIKLDHSPDNTIRGNTITNCIWGVVLSSSSSNTLTNNTMSSTIAIYELPYSFAVWGSSLEEYVNYVDASNTVNGKPIYYLVNRRGLTVPSDAGCVILVNCTGITVQNLNLTGNFPSICLAYTTDSTITQNEVSMASSGIMLYFSSNNVISKNKVTSHFGNNWMGGICLISSNSNTIFGNNITEATFIEYRAGSLWLYSSSLNVIYENTITAYTRGIFLNSSANNMIYHNNFINGTQQAYSLNSVNVWDDGYPSGGNYWSDYAGVDEKSGPNQDQPGSDGIGDTPYVIDAENQDRYPLMHPCSLPVHNINTGLGYATIQEAINAPETIEGHKIFVEAGTYVENVVVNKNVSVIGENVATTIIDGGGSGTVVKITVSGVQVTGFTIRNSGDWPNAGIRLEGISYCNISGNNITNNYEGILLDFSSNNSISGNNITANNGFGISLYESSNYNSIAGNNITANNWDGIRIGSSSNNSIAGNNIAGNYIANNYNGLSLWYSFNNTVSGNNVTNNQRGIYLGYSSNNRFYHNNFIDNAGQVDIYPIGYANVWDDGYPSGGNYWSDYVDADMFKGSYQNETGSDGIWDSPYTIDEHNRDNYPLVDTYTSYTAPAVVEWNRTYGTTNNDWAVSLLQTIDGGFAMAGPWNCSGDISSVGIVKTDSNGNVQWTRTFEVDSFMGVGVFDQCALFETEERAFVFSSSINITGNIDIWLLKVDEDGQPIWNHTYGGTGNEMLMSAVQTDDDGFLLVAWNYTVGGGTWLVKTDAYGNVEWEKTCKDWIGIYSVKTVDGGFALTGCAFQSNDSSVSAILLKMDAAGNILWNQTILHYQTPIPIIAIPRLLQVVDKGFVLVGTQMENNDSSILLVRTDEDGNIEWNKTYDNNAWEMAFSITEMYDGFGILGYTNASTTRGLGDVWLIRTDLTGNVLWDSTYGGEGMDIGFSIITTRDGGLAFAGGTNSSGTGEMDFWLAKLSPETQENESLILEVPYQYQGDTSWCVPTSLAMALRYYGVSVHFWEIAEFLGLERGEGAVFGPDLDGQFILTKKLSDYLDFRYPNYRIGYYRAVTSQIFRDIRGNVSLGRPVLLALRKSPSEEGHSIVIVGFNSSGFFFNDPSGGAKDLCDKVTWINSFPAENGYYGFVEDDAISSVICTEYQSGARYVSTGTLLVLYGTPSSTTGALNLYSAPSVGATACCFYIDKPSPFPQVYLDLDKGLTWKSLSFPIGNPIVGDSDILHCRVHIYNHLQTAQTYTILYTIRGYDGITYYLNMTAESLNVQSKGTYTQTVTLGDVLTKTQYYHVQLQLMDSQGKGIDTISIPDIYYFASGTSITLQESQHHLYLHVYDSQGRHVGLNYTNNETDIGVPDAYYFDNSNGTITIVLPTYNSSFLAVVDAAFAQETIETYNLTITTLNNGQVIDKNSIQETIQKGSQTEYDIEISPSGTIITVPEFSPFLILPLFMIATLLAVILYKRKQELTFDKG